VELLLLLSVLAAGLGLLGVIGWRERPAGVTQTVELRFGTDVTIQAVEAMLAGVASLPSNAVVRFDVFADESGLRHFLRAPQSALDTLRSQWRGVLPSLRMDEAENPPVIEWSGGALLRLSGTRPVLRSDAIEESVAATLGALQPLAGGETLQVSWLLTAARRPSLPLPSSQARGRGAGGGWAALLGDTPLRSDHLRMLSAKYAGPILSGVGVVAVAGGHPKRAAHLVSRVVSVARSRGGAYGHVTTRRRSAKQITRLLDRPRLTSGDVYCPSELAGLVNLPIAAPPVAGLVLGVAPVLMPSPRIPSKGRVFGVSTWPGSPRILAQPVLGGLSHGLATGPSGTGKSSLTCSLLAQDLEAGRGFVLIDGKGDLARDALSRIPARRLSDVIVVDPAAGGPQPGLRLFAPGNDPHLTADLIVNVLAAIAPGEWGPMSARWLKAALVLTAHDENGSLASLPFVFSDDAYRARLLARLNDPIAQGIWAAFSEMKPAERAHQLAAPLGKVEEIIGRPVMRALVGQTPASAKLDMAEVLRTGKVVIVSLSPGQIGGAARLLGALIVHQFFLAVQARSALAESERRPAFLYVDEPKVLGDIPVPLDSLYELARGMGCGVLLSAQSLSQLPADLRAAAMTNSSTLVAFGQNNSADAKLLSAELPNVSSEALQHLGQYEVMMRLGLGPRDVTAPVSARTLPPPPPISDPAEVRRASAERYGVDPAEVDAALAKRHQAHGSDETPVGFLRRQP
jgi:hypothetical protein